MRTGCVDVVKLVYLYRTVVFYLESCILLQIIIRLIALYGMKYSRINFILMKITTANGDITMHAEINYYCFSSRFV